MPAAMVPVAPVRLSMTICWLQAAVNRGASMRATTSVPPPGAKPTSMRTGRLG
jgi:hypothetical protein